MPNWCYNSITIHHEDPTAIDAIEQQLKSDSPEIAQTIRPRPADVEDWYNWNVNNWGTKWDLSVYQNDYIRDDENTICFNFDSAWSPPIALYYYMTEQGYDIISYYHEGGMAFCGKFEGGCDYYYDYDWTRDSIEQLPEDIEQFAGLLESYDDYVRDNETEVG